MDDIITLIKDGQIDHDEHGNEIITQTERDVFCQIYGVSRGEFYSAAVANLQPELTVRLTNSIDYEGETTARYNGTMYSVIRTYRDNGSTYGGNSRMPYGSIELTLERRIGDG